MLGKLGRQKSTLPQQRKPGYLFSWQSWRRLSALAECLLQQNRRISVERTFYIGKIIHTATRSYKSIGKFRILGTGAVSHVLVNGLLNELVDAISGDVVRGNCTDHGTADGA